MWLILILAWIAGLVLLCTGYDPIWLLVAVSIYFGRLTFAIELQAALENIKKQARASRARRS